MSMFDTTPAAPGESHWGMFMRQLGNLVKPALAQNPLLQGSDILHQGVDWLNQPASQGAATAAPADPLKFTPYTSTAAAATPAPTLDQAIADPASMFKSLLGGDVTITSGYRPPGKNNVIPGATKNGDHTVMGADGQPEAWDINPPKGMTTAQAAVKLAAAGFGTIDEGNHVHVSRNPVQIARGALQGTPQSGFIQLAPSVAPGDITHAAPFVAADPQMLMGMIKDPKMVPNVHLPKAPVMQAPPDMPAQSLIDPHILDELASVIKPKARDTSHDAWDRFSALLQGAAQGASGVSPTAGVGRLILGAGAGAAKGFATKKEMQQAEQDRNEEAIRQASVVLAQFGINIKEKNINTGNENLDRAWKSAFSKVQTANENVSNADARRVQEILANHGVAVANTGAVNSTNAARAGVGIQALEGIAGGQNRANAAQEELNLRGAGGAGQATQIDAMLVKAGIPAKDSNDPLAMTTRGTAAAILGKNVDGALQNMATELVHNGAAAEILKPQKGDTPAAAKAKAQALAALKTAKKGTDPGATAATQIIAQLLSTDHNAALAIAKAYATTSPSARLILQNLAGGQ